MMNQNFAKTQFVFRKILYKFLILTKFLPDSNSREVLQKILIEFSTSFLQFSNNSISRSLLKLNKIKISK